MRIKRFIRNNRGIYLSITLILLYLFVGALIIDPINLENQFLREEIEGLSDPENMEQESKYDIKNEKPSSLDEEVDLFSKISEDVEIVSVESKSDEEGRWYLFKAKNDMMRFENFLLNMEKNKYGARLKEVVLSNEGKNKLIDISVLMN